MLLWVIFFCVVGLCLWGCCYVCFVVCVVFLCCVCGLWVFYLFGLCYRVMDKKREVI
jgi:hypothetical protein